jgi:uncharacterized protein involved in type VI secretion and phage assembly
MFYRGIVENNIDPEQFGRVQVRVMGIHDSGSNVSTSALPWAEVSGGTDFGLVNGVGVTSVLRVGTMVWVFFNNDDFNYPVVFATIKGASDINDVAKGSYGSSATIKTASGHIIEFCDVSGSEKIEIKHTSGSKIIFQADGTILIDSVNNMIHNVSGNYDITAGGNYKVTAARIDLN